MSSAAIDELITVRHFLCMALIIKSEGYRDESIIIDKICDKALAYSLEVGLSCGDATFNTGGPAHHPYFEAWAADRRQLERLAERVLAYSHRFKGVWWEVL